MQAALHGGAKAPDGYLEHHHRQPDQSGADVQTVTADKGEKGGKKSAALRGGAAGDHAHELAEFESEKRRAEQEGNKRKKNRCRLGSVN